MTKTGLANEMNRGAVASTCRATDFAPDNSLLGEFRSEVEAQPDIGGEHVEQCVEVSGAGRAEERALLRWSIVVGRDRLTG